MIIGSVDIPLRGDRNSQFILLPNTNYFFTLENRFFGYRLMT